MTFMTLPKGYVPPNKKADEKTKQLADEKTKQLADEKTKQLADEKTKQLADEKTKQLADEKTISKESDAELIRAENSSKKSVSQNGVDYALLWDEMKKAYMQTAKEATISYFRLLNIWMKDFKK
jgi:hypothetical protein